MKYVYSVIRFVPDPVRGEFVNVGTIVGSDETAEWTVKKAEDIMRARALDRGGALPAVSEFVDHVSRQIRGRENGHALGTNDASTPSEDWLSQLHLRCTNVIQVSEPLPIVASDLNDAVETVFGQLVA